MISLTSDPQESLNSAFRIAARENRLDDAERFLEQGAGINSPSDEGETALMYAARNCSKDTVKLLMIHGADANRADSQGRTALIYAAQNSCAPVVELLMRSRKIEYWHCDKAGKAAKEYAIENAALDVDGPPIEAVRLLRIAERTGGVLLGVLRPNRASEIFPNGNKNEDEVHVQ